MAQPSVKKTSAKTPAKKAASAKKAAPDESQADRLIRRMAPRNAREIARQSSCPPIRRSWRQ